MSHSSNHSDAKPIVNTIGTPETQLQPCRISVVNFKLSHYQNTSYPGFSAQFYMRRNRIKQAQAQPEIRLPLTDRTQFIAFS